jgi:hypothetical protein
LTSDSILTSDQHPKKHFNYLILDKSGPATPSTPPHAAQKGVEKVSEAPVSRNKAPEAKVSRRDEGGDIWSDKPWVLSPKEFSAPPRAPEALSVSQVQAGNEGISSKGFLGKAVGSVHESLKYWKCDTKEDWENRVYTLRRPLGVCKIT